MMAIIGFSGEAIKGVDLWIAKTILEGQMLHKHPRLSGTANPPSDDLKAALKALTSDGTGSGDELVPTEMAAQLWQDIYLSSLIASTIRRVDMPSNPFDLPNGLGEISWRKGSENTAGSASDPSTAKSTLTATELMTEQNWSYTLDEDAIVALAPALRQELARSGGQIIDAFILNADGTTSSTGNINSDDAAPDNDSYYLSDGDDGIRHLWLADNTDQQVDAGGDALSDTDMSDVRGKLGKYGINPNDVVSITDIDTYLTEILDLTNAVTVDKYGPNAVVLTGELAKYRGIPIVVSPEAPLTEDDGKVSDTAASNTQGQISMYNRRMWSVGFRRNILIEMDRDIQRRMYIMVTSLRIAVACWGTRSSAEHTAGIYDIGA